MKDRPHKIRIPKRCPDCGETLGPCEVPYHGLQHLEAGTHSCPDAVRLVAHLIASSYRMEPRRFRNDTYDPAFP